MILFLSQMPWDFWLLFVFLAAVIPWRGRLRLRKLLSLERVSREEKIKLYLRTIAFQWLLVALVAWRALARGLSPADVGVSSAQALHTAMPAVVGALLIGGLHWINLRRVARMDGEGPRRMRELAARILPRSGMEFVPYFALAITAGLCEEFLYRGFAMAALLRAGVPGWATVVLTAVLFGLAHTYQGRSGVVGTSLMGLVFGGFRLLLGSLLPVAVWHAVVDVVAGIAGHRFLLQEPVSPPDAQ